MSNQTKARKPVKLATQSDHAAYFMPMLESFAEHGELNEVIKTRGQVLRAARRGRSSVPQRFRQTGRRGRRTRRVRSVHAEELESVDARFSLAGRMVSSRSFGKVIFFHCRCRAAAPVLA